MILATDRVVFREIIHWAWLWTLAAILVSIFQTPIFGRDVVSGDLPYQRPGADAPIAETLSNPSGVLVSDNVGLRDVLQLNRQGEFERVIPVWKQLDVAPESRTWVHVGIGAAHLRLEELDQAEEQFKRALECDPENAVAEYFLARLCQARSRKVPFWYEKDVTSPFRLISETASDSIQLPEKIEKGRGAILPQYKTYPYDRQAKRHFRRAIAMSKSCPIDREIKIVQPQLRLIDWQADFDTVTVRDLLRSLDEEDFVEKARLEVEEHFVSLR